MGKKMQVSLALEGKLASDGLTAMDDDDDVLTALARELVIEKGISERAAAVWKIAVASDKLQLEPGGRACGAGGGYDAAFRAAAASGAVPAHSRHRRTTHVHGPITPGPVCGLEHLFISGADIHRVDPAARRPRKAAVVGEAGPRSKPPPFLQTGLFDDQGIATWVGRAVRSAPDELVCSMR